jgi:rhodanese-related sulfurtransferase
MTIKSSKTLVEEASKEIDTFSPEKVKELHESNSCALIDIRDIRELENEGSVDGAIHVPRGMLEFWLDPSSSYFKNNKFSDQSKKIILFCAGGLRSALGAKSLKDMGYENVAHVQGGFASMRLSGFKLKKRIIKI